MAEGLVLPTPEGIPKRIGKYRILRQIAQGGMAEIYLASATGIEGFEKLCVLKRILPLLATNAEFVQMFLDEARIAASLLHSNIAQVFDIGSDNGSYYFVMEFLRGEDVRHILQSSLAKQTFVPYEHVVSIIAGVCSGLHYAHEMRGKDGKPLSLVHRDISPQNIFVTHDGNVKLCDFGIAKSAAQLTETRVGTL
jgi:serine/threonine protein kinase